MSGIALLLTPLLLAASSSLGIGSPILGKFPPHQAPDMDHRRSAALARLPAALCGPSLLALLAACAAPPGEPATSRGGPHELPPLPLARQPGVASAKHLPRADEGASADGPQSEGHEGGDQADSAPHGTAHGQGEFERNAFSLLLRQTFETGGEGGVTFGLEYERLLSRRWGVGGMVEYIAGDVREAVVGVMGYYHPTHRLALAFGTGIEFDRGNESYALARLGVLYEYPVGGIYISPALFVDMIDNGRKAVLVGLTLTRKF